MTEASSPIAWSAIISLAAARLRAGCGELLPQRGEFPLDLNHFVRLGQVGLQARVLASQPSKLVVP